MAILSKDQYVHAAMKFVLKNPSEDGTKTESNYIINLYEANESVNWRDVIQAKYDMASETEVQCPICMEPLSHMVCPRLTKCGHIYCFACMLQYLDFEREKSWKRCPLCFDPVYKRDLKYVEIRRNHFYKVGQTMKFHLMVRSRANLNVKNKKLESDLLLEEDEKGTILCNDFPIVAEDPQNDMYKSTKMRLNSRKFYRDLLTKEMLALQEDHKFKTSCGEVELLEYIDESI